MELADQKHLANSGVTFNERDRSSNVKTPSSQHYQLFQTTSPRVFDVIQQPSNEQKITQGSKSASSLISVKSNPDIRMKSTPLSKSNDSKYKNSILNQSKGPVDMTNQHFIKIVPQTKRAATAEKKLLLYRVSQQGSD